MDDDQPATGNPQSAQALREVLDCIDESFITLDAGWRFTFVNAGAERLFGRPAAELLGAVVWSIFPASVGTATQQAYEQALHSRRPVTFVDYNAARGRWFEVRAIPLSSGLTVYFRDITRQKDHEARLEYQAGHDCSTGLLNQRSLVRELTLLLPESRRRNAALGVAVIAIEGHRTMAAHLGHALVEQLVLELANRLRRSLPADVVAARSAENEFTLIVPATDRETLQRQAAQWVEQLGEPIRLGRHSLRADLCAGTSWQAGDGFDATTLIANAKVALASACAAGPGTAVGFTPVMRERAERRQLLHDGMRDDGFLSQLEMHYQPQVRLSDRKLIGLEALIRWRSPLLGQVPPGEFIPLAERSGIIESIGRWAIDHVCHHVAAWRAAGLAPPPVAVNASAREVLRPDYAAALLKSLQDHGLGCDSLCVEITESVAVDNFDAIRPTLEMLVAAGVQVHLDDFGEGYCNLRRLQSLDLHTLKIDRSLVAGLDSDPAAVAMLRAVVELARSLHKEVLVEGIETEAELAAARAAGCDVGQGYLFGRPMPVAELNLPRASDAFAN